MASRRVVITGMGLIGPLGNSPQQAWEALCAGTSGVGRLTHWAEPEYPFGMGGEAREFRGEIDDFGPLEGGLKKSIRKGLKMMCREIQMGVAATQRALTDAGHLGAYAPERIGVVFGVDHITTEPAEFTAGIRGCLQPDGHFAFDRWGALGMPQITPLWLLKYLPNMPASHVAIYNDFRGPSNSLTMREVAANLALGEATSVIQRGAADAMVVGATGTRLHLLRSIHIALQETVHPWDPELPGSRWSRPFDLMRRGMVLAEGAAAIILEDAESAAARGARIWGEIKGWGSAMAAHGLSRADLRQSLTTATQAALRQADLDARHIDHIHAHGASTLRMDIDEATALQQLFPHQPPVTSLKSYTGNMGAGSGLAELICSVMALHEKRLFPSLNCEQVDPACPIHVVQSASPLPPAGQTFLNVSLAPQGQAAVAIVGQP